MPGRKPKQPPTNTRPPGGKPNSAPPANLKQRMTSGDASGQAGSRKRLKITVETPKAEEKIDTKCVPHTYMIVTDALRPEIWKNEDKYHKKVLRAADSARQVGSCHKVTLDDLVPQDTEKQTLLANENAKDLFDKLKDRVEEMKEVINKLQQRLSVIPPDQLYLMDGYLHHRYRTMWQICRNTGQLPQKPLDPNPWNRTKEEFDMHADLFPTKGNLWQYHSNRFELASSLGHRGDLRADILAGQSDYVDMYHSCPDMPGHKLWSKILYEKLFEKVYKLHLIEAKWLVDASVKSDGELQLAATHALRIIERYVFIVDFIYHKIARPTPGLKDVWWTFTGDDRYPNLQKLQKAYAEWMDGIKRLIHPPGDPNGFMLIEHDQCDLVEFERLMDKFYGIVKQVSDRSGGRESGWIDWYMFSTDPRVQTEGPNMKLWKPARVLQLEYNDRRWEETFWS